MTHQPPMPHAATSPYPLHPEPIPEEVKLAHAEAEKRAQAEAEKPAIQISNTLLGVGAAIGVGAAAAVTGLLYARRKSAKASAAQPKKRSGDDKSKRGKDDRNRVSASEPYEVSYFARKHKIKAAEARAILKEAGTDRAAANALAASRKQA